jgi:Transposase DDE domain
MLYRASNRDCQSCALKSRCCPTSPARKVPRSIHERARDIARRIATSWQGSVSRRLRKKVEMLFAHLKRILRLDRLRLRGPNGARDEFILAATAQNLRKLAKLIPMPSPAAGRAQSNTAALTSGSESRQPFSTQSANCRHQPGLERDPSRNSRGSRTRRVLAPAVLT